MKATRINSAFYTKNILFCVVVFISFCTALQAQFSHPGISHKLSDLDRMKYMVEAGIEPWKTTFDNLSDHPRASHTYNVNVVNQDPSFVTTYSAASRNWFINDGTAAYYNALMWYITGDTRHADKAVEIFNTYKGLRNNTTSIPLESGRVWRIIEAAEIIEHTYDGWAESDIQEFKDMLVHPGYSNRTVPTQDIANNNFTFYWHVYNGDPGRHGNQGLFGMRTMMAIAIFLDNEIMYDRALRYLKGESHRSDDLEYPSGPSINSSSNISECDYFEEYSRTGQATTITDYGYNEVVSNYIFENGQSQESSRDQAHALGGVSTISVISEMAWNQGDDLYGHLDNRPLLGLEFFYRYNLSSERSYPDQTSPWEPTIASGEYIERTDRSGRWRSRLINPGVNCDQERVTRGGQNLQPVPEMNLAHYKDRMQLPSNDYKWLERAHEFITAETGVEGEGTVTDHPGYGSLKFRRVSSGDPINGFDNNGLPVYAMNVLPMTIEAENFDYFVTNGEDKTYNETSTGNQGGMYRPDESVDIETRTGGGYNIGWITEGEWLTYTVYVPETTTYDIAVSYAAANNAGEIKFEFSGMDKTGVVTLPSTGGFQIWRNYTIASGVILSKGVQSMKVLFSGASSSFNLNSLTISEEGTIINPPPITNGNLVHITKRNASGFAIDGGIGGSNGQNVTLSVANTADAGQLWVEIDRGNGFYSYEKYGTNHSLDGRSGGATGQNVYLWETNATNQNQQWQKVAVGDGGYKLIKRNATGFAINGGSGGRESQNINLYRSSSNSQNLQWYITPINVAEDVRLEAEDFDAMSGIQTEASTESGDNVGYINNGDWLRFDNVNLSGITNMDARVASNFTGGTIEVRTGSVTGTLIGTIDVSNTGGNQNWRTLNTNISNASGTQDVYLVFTGGNGFLYNVNWVEFNTNSRSNKDIDEVTSATSEVKLYPNPVVSTTTIENAANTVITVYDMNGSMVLTKVISSENELIDLSVLSTGMYYGEVKGEGTLSIVKIVKE